MADAGLCMPCEDAQPDGSALVDAARRGFGLSPIQAFEPMPAGWAARSYRLDDDRGRPYVLKVYGQAPDARTWLAAMVERLPILHDLHQSGRFPWLPAPVMPCDGSFRVRFGTDDLLLSTYIPGDHPPEDYSAWPEELVEQLAERIAALHSVPTTGLVSRLPREEFSLTFRPGLEAGLRRLESLRDCERSGVIALRDLLLPRREELAGLIDRTEQLAALARTKRHALVPCHSDLHRWHLILREDGDLCVLDWEGLRLAPAEQDLFFWADEPIGATVLQRYLRARPRAALDADTFAYYYYYRNLEDLEAWVSRILHRDRDCAADTRDLDGIRSDCLPWWGELEPTIDRVRARMNAIDRVLR